MKPHTRGHLLTLILLLSLCSALTQRSTPSDQPGFVVDGLALGDPRRAVEKLFGDSWTEMYPGRLGVYRGGSDELGGFRTAFLQDGRIRAVSGCSLQRYRSEPDPLALGQPLSRLLTRLGQPGTRLDPGTDHETLVYRAGRQRLEVALGPSPAGPPVAWQFTLLHQGDELQEYPQSFLQCLKFRATPVYGTCK